MEYLRESSQCGNQTRITFVIEFGGYVVVLISSKN